MITIRTTRFWPALEACTRSRLPAADWRAAAAFGLPFALYLLTLAPTVYNLDSVELTTAAATGGLVRATGYPLYLLVGRLWSWLPLGDVGYRMNLFSAFNGALTIFLADRLLRRLNVGPWAALGALGLLATATHFWALSLVAEVYTLHTALMAGLLLSLMHWSGHPTPTRLGLVGLMLGLGLSHHAATVLLIPGCAFYVIAVARRRAFTPRALLAALGGVLLGSSLYLYLAWRSTMLPVFNYVGSYDAHGMFHPIDLRRPEGMWWLISGRAFAGQMLGYRGEALWREIVAYARLLWRAFFAVGLGPGLLGLIVLMRRDWKLGGLLLAMFAFNAAFYIDYRVVDKDTMFLPTYLIWAVWLGVGYQWLIAWTQGAGLGRSWGLWLMSGVVAGAVLAATLWNWRLVNLSNDWSARERGEAILRQVEPDALVFGWWDTVPVVEYLQLVEGQRPDVKAVNRFLVPYEALTEWVRREAGRRPVYLDNPPSELLDTLTAEAAGPVYRLRPRATPQGAVKE